MKFEQLARLEREAGLRAANDNVFDDYDAPVDDDDTPIGGVSLRDGASKARAALRLAEERQAMNAQLRRIMERQSIGELGVRADNDNTDWALGGVLKRERLTSELAAADRYRALVRTARYDLRGQAIEEPQFLYRDRRKLTAKSEEARMEAFAAADFPGNAAPGGELQFGKGIVRLKKPASDSAPKRAVVTNEESRQLAKPTPKPFDNSEICAAVDARTTLAELRIALGRLVDPLDDAVLAGMKFEEIGRDAMAIADSDKATGAGRALVLTGLRTLIDTWSAIEERERKLARATARRAKKAGLT